MEENSQHKLVSVFKAGLSLDSAAAAIVSITLHFHLHIANKKISKWKQAQRLSKQQKSQHPWHHQTFSSVKMFFKANIRLLSGLHLPPPPKWGKQLDFSLHLHNPDERHPQLSPRLPQQSVLSTFNMIESPSIPNKLGRLSALKCHSHYLFIALWWGLGVNYTALRLIYIIHNASDTQMHIFYHV